MVNTNISEIKKKTKTQVLETTSKFQEEYKKNVNTAVLTGLAFVIGLYAKDTIQLWVEFILKALNIPQGTGLIYKTIITLIVIGIAVFAMVLISRWSKEEDKEIKE